MKASPLIFICPIISTIFITYLCFFPEKILEKIPSIIKLFLKNDEKNKLSYKDYLPAIPKEPIAIWKLSQLEHTLSEIEKKYSNNPKELEEQSKKIISQVKEIVGEGQMTVEILHKLPQYLEELDKNSLSSRIKGFFSFINIIWMIAILGIVVSVGPALYFV